MNMVVGIYSEDKKISCFRCACFLNVCLCAVTVFINLWEKNLLILLLIGVVLLVGVVHSVLMSVPVHISWNSGSWLLTQLRSHWSSQRYWSWQVIHRILEGRVTQNRRKKMSTRHLIHHPKPIRWGVVSLIFGRRSVHSVVSFTRSIFVLKLTNVDKTKSLI